jgi:predicted phosphohydrolase
MKIRVLSDLHLEFANWRPPPCDEDVVVLAGDIAEGRAGIAWARKYFRDRPIIYVPGNHEYYGRDFDELREGLRESGRAHDVHVLDGDEVIVDGVRFLGATLWTDFEIDGCEPKTVEAAMRCCQEGMADFQIIRRWGSSLRPTDTREIHQAQREWLRRALMGCTPLGEDFSGATVVVTHHAPSPRSIAPRFVGDTLNPAFASDVTDLMGPAVQLWIHGHMHQSYDYIECGTRVVCNPRGYLPLEPNPDFDPMLIVEVPA